MVRAGNFRGWIAGNCIRSFDLLKLSVLRRPETDFIGLLLIGFEKFDNPMDADIDLLKNLAGLSDWTESSDDWESCTVSEQRVRCWFWHREADGHAN